MTLLSRNTTSAERARGCVFSELFRDGESIARNGGTVTGTPAIDKGVTLNGTTDYLTYDAVGSFFASSEISIVVEFWPDFNPSSGVDRYIFDSDSAARYLCYINAAGQLYTTLANVTNLILNKSIYETYWVDYGKNVLVISGKTAAVNYWLNGVLIGSSSAAWVPKPPSFSTIGARYTGISPFDGRITKFQIYDRLLTAGEAADFYNGGIYSYRNEPSLNLPFGMAQHDPTNTRSLDVSGNARHATLVGTPTKLGDKPGYELNGTTQHMTVPGTGVFNAAGVTIAIEFDPLGAPDSTAGQFFMDSSNLNRYLIYISSAAGTNRLTMLIGAAMVFTVPLANYLNYWYVGRRNILVMSGVSGDSSLWLNGNLIATSAVAWAPQNPAVLYLATVYNTSARFNCIFNSFRVWREALTPLQVADLC